jgi:hypothetical protein
MPNKKMSPAALALVEAANEALQATNALANARYNDRVQIATKLDKVDFCPDLTVNAGNWVIPCKKKQVKLGEKIDETAGAKDTD